ncbi:MAG TPA: selenide, water dikinase SelD [Anaerolineales bacterium]|nr:selenide, water dikinase SelD [Anaerolineales bacterium]
MSEDATRLTAMARGAGCGCKLGQGLLARALGAMPALRDDPDILVGLEGLDDAAVYRVREDLAVVASVDFFTPVVDDPATFGRIAATNALSDLYAMGATPTFALAVAAYPKEADPAALADILRGGAEVAAAEGCPVLGGHTVDDPEPKYGLAVVGTAHPDRVMTNAAGRPGDVLVLTKPLGTGVTATALKRGEAGEEDVSEAVAWMKRLNAVAGRMALENDARGVTDISGFGLLGHLDEMVKASGTAAELFAASIPVLRGARGYAAAGQVPGGTKDNRAFFGREVAFDEKVDETERILLFDAQTSGGLLLAVPPERLTGFLTQAVLEDLPHWAIGRIVEGHGIRVRTGRLEDSSSH